MIIAPMTEDRHHYEWQLPATYSGGRLDLALCALDSNIPRSRWQRWIKDQRIIVDGQVAEKPKQMVCAGQRIEVFGNFPEIAVWQAEAGELSVVYEDSDLLVIDKPANLVVHPAPGNWQGTLANRLLHAYPELYHLPRAGIVHRLDKDTTGLLIVARSELAHQQLIKDFALRRVEKSYDALVGGVPLVAGTIDQPIARHPRQRTKMAIVARGKTAQTHWQRLSIAGDQYSWLRCRLISGRTHQIRVHCQYAGFPLLGDPLYAPAPLKQLFHRQALHACSLAISHPRTGEAMNWQSDCPMELQDLWSQLKRLS